ncbi:MAG TPA: hypothetical protein VIK22_11015 [Candidatus Anoxymicrobiaceae bacterium]
MSDEQRRNTERENAETLQRVGLKPRVVELWEDGYRTASQPDAFEWWYFDSEFEDGSTAVVVFSTKPMTKPHDPLTPALQIIMKTPEGKRDFISIEHTPNEFNGSVDSCDVSMGKSRIKGDLDGYEVHAQAGNSKVDLVFTRGAPSWRPGPGITYMDRKKTKYFAWVVAVPYGKVEGELTYEGKTWNVTGTGYHDHNWGNIGPGMALDHWYWGRAHVGDFSVIFAQMITAKVPGMGNLKLPVFYLARGQEILTDDGLPLSMVTRDFVEGPGGRTYPTSVDLYWETVEGKVSLALRNPKLIESIDILESLPRWERPIVHLFAKPYYYDFNADLEMKVDLRGVKADEKGTALYELMMLR